MIPIYHFSKSQTILEYNIKNTKAKVSKNVKTHILVVEDSEMDRLKIKACLSHPTLNTTFETTIASSYDEGLESLQNQIFDLMLVDQYLDGSHTGMELIHQVRRLNLQLPYILMSHSNEYELGFSAMEAGASDFILKTDLSPVFLERSIRYTLKQFEYEQKLVLSKKRLSLALEATQSYVFELNLKTGRMNCDAQTPNLLGFNPRTLKDWLASVPYEDHAEVLEEIEETRNKQSFGKISYWTADKIQCIQVHFQWHTQDIMVGVFSDITVEKSYEKHLQNANQRLEERVHQRTLALEETNRTLESYRNLLENVIEAVPIGIIVTNTKGEVYMTNQVVREFFSAEILTHSLFQWTPQNLGWKTNTTLDMPFAPLREKKNIFLELEVPAQENTKVYLVKGVLLDSAHHEDAIDMVSFFDITPLKETEIALTEAREKADGANQAKSLFLANMSHEIRTPMNAILGFSQLLQESPDLKTKHREKTGLIIKNANFLLDLINHVLDMSKIESGHIRINTVPTGLLDLFKEIYSHFETMAHQKSLSFTLNLCEIPDLYLYLDPIKLKQVLSNILSNAFKFTDVGGVDMQVTLEDDILSVIITDSGTGISEKDLPHIFSPFEQAKESRFKGPGSGLGLSISKEYIKLMQGQLQIQSTLHQGSIVTLTIPVERSEKNHSDDPGSGNMKTTSTDSVPDLVVHDHSQIQTAPEESHKKQDKSSLSDASQKASQEYHFSDSDRKILMEALTQCDLDAILNTLNLISTRYEVNELIELAQNYDYDTLKLKIQ